MAPEGWDPVPADELERYGRRFAAVAGGDIEAEYDRWAPDAELHSTVAGVLEGEQGGFRGPDGLMDFRRELAEAFERYGFEPQEVHRRQSHADGRPLPG